MILKNAMIVTPEKKFLGYMVINDKGKVIEIKKGKTSKEGYDCQGQYLMPGFIDPHTHGGYGLSFDDFSNDKEYINKLNNYLKNLASEGVTGVVPTTVTQGIDKLNVIVDNFQEYLETNVNKELPKILGWFFEGPFISKSKKGAHDETKIVPLNEEFLKSLINKIKLPIIMAIAPEENDMKLINKYKDNIIFALGHSNATYKQAIDCLENGTNRVVHFYNAMSGFSHRDLGIVNAVLENKLVNKPIVEIISDNVHVDNKVVDFTFKTLNRKNMTIVSDSLCPKGLKDGPYKLGSLDIEKKGNWCYLKGTTTLSGGCCKYNVLVREFKRATNCSFEELVCLTSLNDKISLYGKNKAKPSLLNKPADLVLVDEDINILFTMVNGKIIYERK